MYSGRNLRLSDWVALRETLSELLSKPSNKLAHKIANLDIALHNLNYSGHKAMVGGYFVYFDTGTPWYSDRAILSELLIVRVLPGGTLRDVAGFLEEQAALHDLSYVCIGTAFSRSDRALARLWQNMGYTEQGITLAKEL